MGFIMVLIVATLVLAVISYMYLVESNWYGDDFKLDDEDDIG